MRYVLVMLVLASCGSSKGALSNDDVVNIANAYIEDNMVEDLRVLRPSVENRDDYWIVRYKLPPNYMGGEPVITINKRSREVISAVSGQ